MSKKPKDLEVKTVNVEIKVVRIGGAKMTLATFKQVPRLEFCNIDAKSIMGWVRWVPGDCALYLVLAHKDRKLCAALIPSHLLDSIKQRFDQIYIAT